MKPAIALILVTSVCALPAQDAAVGLPEMTVYSPRVANQSPVGTFAMPVSALRYEPRVDLQSRNLSEGQADVTIRGGIFENTGMRLGAVALLDPQTGHYLAEIPVAPAMLGAPEVLTGADHAIGAVNSTVGAVAQGWRPIKTAGSLALAGGQYGLNRQEIYQGYLSDARLGGQRLAADVAWGRSEANGSVAYGEQDFDRINARIQLSSTTSQTDLFAGYQAKFFGWPNLYTPFNSNETENLQTLLFALNHRTDLGGGDYVEGGLWHRKNKDDYAFNRFAPLGVLHPFQHTTWADGAALGGRKSAGDHAVNFRGEVVADDLRSTSLTAGRYHSRTLAKVSLVPEKSWTPAAGERIVVKAGASYDDSNRGGSAVSPVFELARERPAQALARVYLSYAQTTQLPTYTALNSSATAGLFRGNPDLGREKSRNLELGVSGKWAVWSGQAAVFYRQDDALVDWTFRRGVTARAANAVDIDTTGVELVARRTWGQVDLVLGYTGLTKDADYRGAAVDASFYALNYARHRLTAAVTARLGRGFELRMDNVARIQADNLLRVTGGDDALTSSLGLAYHPPGWKGVEFSVLADNLWDSRFQDVPAVPAARRQISVGASYAW
ncbi:MAG: TonB-dependent receptor [Verrucomicrobia bacterium]|nr:TonB-dependent receptor [Verrucomicrobiota bacterium]